jgi:hypothetical protein
VDRFLLPAVRALYAGGVIGPNKGNRARCAITMHFQKRDSGA